VYGYRFPESHVVLLFPYIGELLLLCDLQILPGPEKVVGEAEVDVELAL
jgi:hypothetical protein